MTEATENFEDEYAEFDEFDDDEERGLSGFAVLIMGLVMIGAFASVVWIAYHQGIKTGQNGETPYVAADPEPIKIESADASDPVEDREVYDVFDGDDDEPVTVLAEGPEEPVNRDVEDTIGAIASDAEDAAADIEDEVNDRLASLEAEDATTFDEPVDPEPEPVAATEPTPTSSNVGARPTVSIAGDALAGSHVVQVGAFRSDQEAKTQWARLQSRLGDFVDGKGIDVEEADLGDRGVYHRLRIGPFSSSDDAKTFCAGLKERGQDCLIKGV